MLWPEAMGAAKEQITTALEHYGSAAAEAPRIEAKQARFFVGGRDNASVVTDHAPDLVSLAKTHADEVVEQSKQLGVKPPNIMSVAYNRLSGQVYFAENPVHYVRDDSTKGIMLVRPRPMHPMLAERTPKTPLEYWAPETCSEVHAVNKGLLEASLPPSLSIHQYERPVEASDFAYATVRIQDHRNSRLHSGEVFPSCRNCQVTLAGAVEVTRPGSNPGLFLGGAVPSEHGRPSA